MVEDIGKIQHFLWRLRLQPMVFPQFRSLKKAFFLIIFPLIISFSLIIFSLDQYGRVRSAYSSLEKKLKLNLSVYSRIISYPLWNVNREQTESILLFALEDPDIIYLEVKDEWGVVFVSAGDPDIHNDSGPGAGFPINLMKNKIRGDKVFSGIETVYFNPDRDRIFIGTISLTLSDQHTLERIHKEIRNFLALLVLVFISFGAGLYYTYTWTVDKPLKKLKNRLKTIQEEEDFPIEIRNWQKMNEISYIHHLFLGIWEKNRKFMKLQEEKERLEEVGRLAGLIAHKFNNQLTSVYGYIQLAQSHNRANEKVASFLEKSIEALDHTLETSNQFLTFSPGGFPAKSKAPLAAFIRNTLNKNCRDSEYKMECSDMIKDAELEFDQLQIASAFKYILDFIEAKKKPHSLIRVNLENRDNETGLLKISFIAGFPEDMESFDFFSPFSDLNRNISDMYLSISRSIILKHDWEISLEGEKDGEYMFLIYFPLP